MVTLPILATIFLSVLLLGIMANPDYNGPLTVLRQFTWVVFGIVTLWLCYASPGGQGSFVCAVILSSWSALSILIGFLTGRTQRAFEDDDGAVMLGFLLTAGIFASVWIPWANG